MFNAQPKPKPVKWMVVRGGSVLVPRPGNHPKKSRFINLDPKWEPGEKLTPVPFVSAIPWTKHYEAIHHDGAIDIVSGPYQTAEDAEAEAEALLKSTKKPMARATPKEGGDKS